MGDIIRKKRGKKDYGWYIRWTEHGKRRERASHQPSYALAKRMLVEIEARVARGEAGIIEPAPRPLLTVAELFEKFLGEFSSPRIKDLDMWRERNRAVLRRFLPFIGHLCAQELGENEVARARDALGKTYAPGTVRSTLTPLGGVYSWALKQGLVEKSPVRGVQRPPAPPPRLDYLDKDEVRALLAESERRARSSTLERVRFSWWSRWVALSLALRLGLRKGELFGLRWSDVDLDAQRLTVARSYRTTPKNGKARHLRLSSALVPLLREWKELCPATPARLVCPLWGRRSGRWQMAAHTGDDHRLPELLRAAACRVFSRPWHMLRHSFASHFVQSGGSLVALSQILGHSDLKLTMIYAHLSSDYLAEQLERVKF